MAIQTAPTHDAIGMNAGYPRAKRVLDVMFTLLILFPLCLVIVIVAVLIRLDSAGPIDVSWSTSASSLRSLSLQRTRLATSLWKTRIDR